MNYIRVKDGTDIHGVTKPVAQALYSWTTNIQHSLGIEIPIEDLYNLYRMMRAAQEISEGYVFEDKDRFAAAYKAYLAAYCPEGQDEDRVGLKAYISYLTNDLKPGTEEREHEHGEITRKSGKRALGIS